MRPVCKLEQILAACCLNPKQTLTNLEQAEYFKSNLSQAVPYLAFKGISIQSAKEFEIGFCPEEYEIFKPFRARIMVPINSASGDLVAFAGRDLSGTSPKWINSPESDSYRKSRLLFNLDRAQDYILRDDTAIIVEGYWDVIQLWQNGIKNVVASCGTALTKYQIRLLKRFADRIVVAYDGDDAGAAAANRALEGLSDEQIPIDSITLPPGCDPDDFVKKEGPEAFLKLIEKR